MQVSVENTSALERRLTVSVPSTDVDAQVEAKLQQTAKTVRIDRAGQYGSGQGPRVRCNIRSVPGS